MSIFTILIFTHFIVDFIFQSHKTAMGKISNYKIRFWHCILYSFIMSTIWLVLSFNLIYFLIILLYFFITHYFIDSYKPVYWWAKYIRKPQEMIDNNNWEGFINFANTSLGKVLIVSIDQFLHIFVIWIILFVFK
jgi:hypothetical protein